MITPLRALVESLDVVAIPNKFDLLTQLREHSDSFCHYASPAGNFNALLDCFQTCLESITTDFDAMLELGQSAITIQSNTQALLDATVEFTAPLSRQHQERILTLRAHASQDLSQEAPTAAYLLYCSEPQYVTLTTTTKSIIQRTGTLVLLLNRLVKTINDENSLDLITAELVSLPPVALADTRHKNYNFSNRLLAKLMYDLNDDSSVESPCETWLTLSDVRQFECLEAMQTNQLAEWIAAIRRATKILLTARMKDLTLSESIIPLCRELSNQLACVATLTATQRMMCTHLRNLIGTQFKMTCRFYDSVLETLKPLVVDYPSIQVRSDELLTELQS